MAIGTNQRESRLALDVVDDCDHGSVLTAITTVLVRGSIARGPSLKISDSEREHAYFPQTFPQIYKSTGKLTMDHSRSLTKDASDSKYASINLLVIRDLAVQ